MSNFEKASKLKLRFATHQGVISTEDLWDLKLETLDTIAKSHNKLLKDAGEESFITPATKNKGEEVLELKMEILKHVIKVKLEEKEAKIKAHDKAEKRKQLIELISKKELSELEGKSKEQLMAELAALD